MRRQRFIAFLASLFMLLGSFDACAQTTPQSTAFSYQGQLNAGGTLPTGIYQFTFTLYDAATGGAPVVGTVPIQTPIQVINGLFTTDLDFGPAFRGAQSWLEVKVGTTLGNEETLAARQPINAVPVAQYAMSSPAGDFADFFAMMPPDNAANVGIGADVQFPQDGPASATGGIARVGPGQFQLGAIGTYQVSFQVSVSEPGQLVVALNGAELAYTTVGRAAGTSQIVGTALVQTSTENSTLSVRNGAGGITAMTITPLAGGTSPVSAHLVITRLH